jgi:hypothetical protein
MFIKSILKPQVFLISKVIKKITLTLREINIYIYFNKGI